MRDEGIIKCNRENNIKIRPDFEHVFNIGAPSILNMLEIIIDGHQ